MSKHGEELATGTEKRRAAERSNAEIAKILVGELFLLTRAPSKVFLMIFSTQDATSIDNLSRMYVGWAPFM